MTAPLKRASSLTDSDLLAQARAGQQQAFSQLVARYEGKVGATIVGMLGNGTEAEDAAQEVFIRFYKSINRFEEKAELGTYLTRIAINLSLTYLKRRKRRQWLSFGQTTAHVPDLPDDALDPARTEIQHAVQVALQQLPVDFRTVVVLRMIEGYSTQETADILKLPMGTVLSRLARGQQKLKPILARMGLSTND